MRMIDRWFPCAEVSEASYQSYGSGLVEKGLFTWFAARPIAQARAAVLTTLLPWPDDEAKRRYLKGIVRAAVGGDSRALDAAAHEVRCTYPEGVRVLDFFSGRAIIPLEAGRAGADAWGIDYSPVATLAGMLLADFPFRDWSAEPALPYAVAHATRTAARSGAKRTGESRLASDVRSILDEIGRRFEQSMDDFYPRNEQGARPWGYFWAQTMPCDECKHRFPLVGSTILRSPSSGKGEPGACFSFSADRASGQWDVLIHEGVDAAAPTLLPLPGRRGKAARCPFCGHPHDSSTIKSKAAAGVLRDDLLLVADLSRAVGPVFRLPTRLERDALVRADEALCAEKPFGTDIPAIPDEKIPPGNHDTVRASLYGVRTYGAMCCNRQTLGFVRLCRIMAGMQAELQANGCSDEYVRALLGYASSVVVRKLRRSTRGATLEPELKKVHDIFKNQASLNYSFDFFETGIGEGAGTWGSLTTNTLVLQRYLSFEAVL